MNSEEDQTTIITCGDCAFWHRLSPPPDDLAAPEAGACRERLHCMPARDPRGNFVPAGVYAVVPPANPSCGRFRPRPQAPAPPSPSSSLLALDVITVGPAS